MALFRLFILLLVLGLASAALAADAKPGAAHWEQLISQAGPEAGEAYVELMRHYGLSAPKRAEAYAQEARKYFEKFPSPRLQAAVESELAYALMIDGRLSEAMTQAEFAMQFATAQKQDSALARAEMNRGSVRYIIGDYEGALMDYQQAGKRYEALGNTERLNNLNKNIGNVLMQLGQYGKAETLYRKLLTYWRAQPGPSVELALAEEGLAATLLRVPRYGEAIEHYREALRILDLLGRNDARHIIYSGLSNAYLKNGEAEQALRTAQDGLDASSRSGVNLFTGNLLVNKAEALLALG